MALLYGTPAGVFRLDDPADPDPAHLLDTGQVYRLERFTAAGGVFAATEGGLFRSTDGGHQWTDLGVPADAVPSVATSPDGRRLYAGSRPAHVHVSPDGGASWERSTAFAALPGREDWANLGSVGPQVRTVATDPAAPGRVAVSVEAAGVYVSPDGGEIWADRGHGVNDDVHHLLSLGGGTFVASCGRGLFRTDDAGRTWTALDTDREQFWHTYFRAGCVHQGRLYAASEDRAERRFSEGGGGGAIWTSTDGGRTLVRERFPGDDETFPVAWCAGAGALHAATERGDILRRDGDGWSRLGQVVEERGERALLAVEG